MATYTATSDGDWGTPATWGETVTVPGASDQAVIPAGRSISISSPTGAVLVTVQGELTIAATLSGLVNLDGGTLVGSGGSSIVGGVSVTSPSTVRWMGMAIQGSFVAAAAVTHDYMSGSLTITATSNLNLGGAAGALPIIINISSGAATLTSDLSCGPVTVQLGTLARGTYTTSCTAYTQTGGTLTGNSTTGTLDVAGNIAIGPGTATSSGMVRQTASGNVAIAGGSKVQALTLATSAGVTSTATGDTATVSLTTGAGTVAVGSVTIYVVSAVNNCLNCPATTTWTRTTGKMVVYLTGLAVGENYIGVPLTVVGTLTASRMDLASQALTLDPGADSSYSGLTATTLRCGAVTLGSASGTARTGRLTIGGTGSVASIARAGSTTGNVLTLSDGATLIASGTLTGTGINLTSGAGAVVVGGTMTGWGQAGETMSGSLVHYWPAAAGTNLSAEVTESSPSRAQRNLRHGRMGALVWLA